MKEYWQTKRLGDLCDFVRGPFGGSLKKSMFVPEGYLVYEQYHAINNDFSFGRYFITQKKFNEMKRFQVFPGDLLISSSGTMGKIAIAPLAIKKGIINQALLKLTPHADAIDKYFLKYILQTDLIKNRYFVGQTGAAIQNIASVKTFKDMVVSLPSLKHQIKIVKFLDGVFEKIERAKENTERNLQISRELFESYLNEIFSTYKNGWNSKVLGEISNIEYGFTDKCKNTGDFRYVRITDIDDNGILSSVSKMYVKGSKEAEKFLLQDSDLLMARTGATFAKVLYYTSIEKSIFASYLIRIRFTEKIINKLYWYFTKTKMYWDQAIKLSSGSAQPQFNGGVLKKVVFKYPKSITEQEKLIKRFDDLYDQTQKLEEIYKQKLADLEELKKSILQKAFAGELVK